VEHLHARDQRRGRSLQQTGHRPGQLQAGVRRRDRPAERQAQELDQVGIDLALDEAQPHDQDQVPEVDQAPG